MLYRAWKEGWASIGPPGYDAGKKIKGKKRHILVDTQGLLIHAIVLASLKTASRHFT